MDGDASDTCPLQSPRGLKSDAGAGLTHGESGSMPAITQLEPIAHTSTEVPEQQSPMGETCLLNKLLDVLLSFPDRTLAVGAATKALEILRHGPEEDAIQHARAKHNISKEHLGRQTSADVESDQNPWEAASAPDGEAPGSRRGDDSASESRTERGERASVIDEYPACKRLMEAYRRVYHMPNKTPLSVLFEYASRLNLQLTFEEGQTSQGHFTLTLQLKNEREACLYRPGIGQAKSKKDAKQLAAAALLEVMLDRVPFQDLLYKSDKQQSFKDNQAQRSHPHAIPKGRSARLGQRHSYGNLAFRGYPGCAPLQSFAGPLSGPHGYSSAHGLSGAYGGLQGMGSNMPMPGPHPDSQGGPFDVGYRQDQRLLFARAGSDPTLGFAASMPSESRNRSAALASNLPAQQMQQELLFNELGLPGMPQQPVHNHLHHQHPGQDSSLAANMAHLGLGQNSLIDDLHGGNWQEPMMQGALTASTMSLASSASPLGLLHQHHAVPQGAVSLPAGAFNLAWLSDNVMH